MPHRNSILLKQSALPQSRPTRPFLLLLWTVAFLAGFLALLEGFARTDVVSRISPAESLGILPSPMGGSFEIKWYRLQQYVAKNGGVDVILIGSSVVNTGIDPLVVAQTYFDQTGTRLRIFNFGVEGLDIVPNSVYAKILVQKYHPALLIFGTVPRDYLGSDNLEVNSLFVSSPWIKYQAGAWNLSGWLIAHSAALRHYLPYRNWMRSDYLILQSNYSRRTNRTSASGYEPDHATATNLEQPPDSNNPDEMEAFEKYRDFKIDPARLGNLQDILNLQELGQTQVIVMEMPLHPTFYDYMGGPSVYREYQQVIEAATTASDARFISSNGAPAIPSNGRPDREHLNQVGAPVLSAYLGNQLAALTKSDGMQFIKTGPGGR